MEKCHVCCGVPLESGKKCICGGAGTHAEEVVGLRKEVHRLDQENLGLLLDNERMSKELSKPFCLECGESNIFGVVIKSEDGIDADYWCTTCTERYPLHPAPQTVAQLVEERKVLREIIEDFIRYANNSQKDILGYVEREDPGDFEDVTNNLHGALSRIKEKLPKILAEKLVVPRAGVFEEPDDELPVYASANREAQLAALRQVYEFARESKSSMEHAFKLVVVPEFDGMRMTLWLDSQRQKGEFLFDTAKRLLE